MLSIIGVAAVLVEVVVVATADDDDDVVVVVVGLAAFGVEVSPMTGLIDVSASDFALAAAVMSEQLCLSEFSSLLVPSSLSSLIFFKGEPPSA